MKDLSVCLLLLDDACTHRLPPARVGARLLRPYQPARGENCVGAGADFACGQRFARGVGTRGRYAAFDGERGGGGARAGESEPAASNRNLPVRGVARVLAAVAIADKPIQKTKGSLKTR